MDKQFVNKRYYQNHKEQLKERSRNRYQQNKETIKRKHKDWYSKHPDKRRQYVNRFNKKLKEKYVSLLGGKCEVCGYNKHIGSLDFHHKDKSKENIRESKTKSFEVKILNGTIQLLCANCHRETHHKTVKSNPE